jgi:hypothetical protein
MQYVGRDTVAKKRSVQKKVAHATLTSPPAKTRQGMTDAAHPIGDLAPLAKG